jgi:pyruvate/2-oxoglutarate/acetoin dehydrogenase E1 component
MKFSEAIKLSTLRSLKENKKFFLFGLEVTNEGAGFIEKFPKQVFETPVSELSSTGLVVGMATRGFKPTIVYGRVEFALLAFDQILTQAGRWNYMFGGNYPCPAKFRVQIGRQWGNGPQHTANYHSAMMQCSEIEIFIPSTPSEAYKQNLYMSKSNSPSILLEHRYLNLLEEEFKIPKNIKRIDTTKIFNSKKKDIIFITYAETLPIALEARKILKKKNIYASIINFSYFPARKRFLTKDLKYINKFKKILLIEGSSFEFGVLSGICSEIAVKLKNKEIHKVSSSNTPAPSSPKLMKRHYVNKNDILLKINKIFNSKIKIEKMSFEESVLWPNINLKKFK